jgi:hypothetical protein
MNHVRSRVFVITMMGLLACLCTAAQAAAQAGTATLAGTVIDDQGAAIPGAVVTVTEQATGAVRATTSNAEGVFRLPGLAPGRYTVDVTLDGFAPLKITDIPLAPAEIRSLEKLQLKVGQLSESLTVTADTAVVQTATSTRYATVTAEQLTNIQMKGRDLFGLLTVVPGVQDTNLPRDFSTWTSMGAITINGMPNRAKNVVVDGVSVVDELGTNAMVNPNIDAVGEVQVISNGFTAENGRSNGGLVLITTKSGTNQFRGSAWYNARRDNWNANEYFRKKQNLDKPLYHVNIPGYGIGGPVLIPKLLDRGKLFFFVSQEFTDDLRPSTITRVNYPTAAEKNGDFSQTYFGTANGPEQGTLQQIINPDTGLPFPGNIIPKSCDGIPGCKNGYIHEMGQKMLNLLPTSNEIHNPQPGQYNAANSAYENLPLHSRTSTSARLDAVINNAIRGSFRIVNDREHNVSNNGFAPGIGYVDNAVPGRITTGSSTQVLSSSIVNEVVIGRAWNSFGFVSDTGKYKYNYRDWWRSSLGVDPPRLEPFGAYREEPGLGYDQADEYPYVPLMGFTGGSRAGLLGNNGFHPGTTQAWVLPAANRNLRWSFQDDLTWTRGRHNLKFGFYGEWASKTEPQSNNYMGNYNFGHDAQNPLSTGNGYANALLGVFNTYTELTNRVDRDRRHWQTEGYLQDSWRMHQRLTLDYGVRLTHSGAYYDTRKSTAGFYQPNWSPTNAPLIYRPVCTTGVGGNVACAANNQRAVDPRNPSVLLPSAFIGNLVPGTGSQINGMVADGTPGLRPGEYWKYPALVAAPRVGFAWDINGDGKQALRASSGVFYAIPQRENWENYVGAPPAAFTRVVQWATLGDIQNFANSNLSFVETPVSAEYSGGEKRSLEKSYNVNVTYQRDIGFNTTAEVAYVGAFTYGAGRTLDINRPVNNLYLLADPSRMFNGNGLVTNLLRTNFPGMGAINQWLDASDHSDINSKTLQYNAMQMSVQRRLSRGLQMGLAYTLAKGQGWTGWNPDIMEADPTGELNRIWYWGPTSNDRTHNLTMNYSYMVPNALPNTPVARWLLGDWQLSGVTKYLSGAATQPQCRSNNTGINFTNPTLTPLPNNTFAHCVYTGEPVFEVTRDPNLAEEDQLHFNPRAFAMASPLSATVGNFGNVPDGILRHPGWWNWDITIARRFAVPPLGPNAQVRLQLQMYNIFNLVQYTNLDTTLNFQDDPNVPGTDNLLLTSTTHGRYTSTANNIGTTPPRQIGITLRLDF